MFLISSVEILQIKSSNNKVNCKANLNKDVKELIFLTWSIVPYALKGSDDLKKECNDLKEYMT